MTNQQGTAVKPGVRSTEFWGKSLLQLVLILNMLFDLGIDLDEQASMTIVAGLEGIYALVRGIAKRPPPVTANVTNAVPAKRAYLVGESGPEQLRPGS